MIRVALGAAAILMWVGCGAPGSQAAGAAPISATAIKQQPIQTGGVLPARSVLDAMPDINGIGPLRFGMTAEQMRKAWGLPLYGGAPANDPQACYYLRPQKNNYDLLFMVERNRFVRVDVKSDSKTAPGGGRAGMQVDELRKLYVGHIKASPNFHDSTATDLRITPPRGEPALLLFEANGKGAVTSWRIGMPRQVDYVEGCK